LDSVSDSTISVSQGSNTLLINTNSNTKFVVYDKLPNGNGVTTVAPNEITIDDLKPGDYLNVNFKVSPSGELVATSVSRVSAASGN
jgi:hypothetical protein